MNKILKKALRTAKELQGEGITYLDNNIKIEAQIDYKVIFAMLEQLVVLIDEKKYEILKNDKEKLLHELAISSINKNDLIYEFSDDFKMAFIKEFTCLYDPELMWGSYYFIPNYVKFQELCEKSLIKNNKGLIRG